MIKKYVDRYIETYLIFKDLKPKNWILLNLIGIFFAFLIFGLGYLVLTIFLTYIPFHFGLILFQFIAILCFIVVYFRYYKQLRKTHNIECDIRSLFVIDLIFFLTIFFMVQTAVLFYAYSSVFIPSLIIFFVTVSSLLLFFSIILTIHLVDLELYPKLFGSFVTYIVFHIFFMRFIPFDAIWIYVISCMLSYVFWLFIYEVKSIFDQSNRLKISRIVVNMMTGVIIFITISGFYNEYKSFFYDQIQVKPQLNMTTIYSDSHETQGTYYSYEVYYAIDGDYTYIQYNNILIILKDDEVIKELELPAYHRLLPSSHDIIFVHQTQFNPDDNHPFYYDIYELDSNFIYSKTRTINTRFEIYGYFKYNEIDFYVGPSSLYLFDGDVFLKNIEGFLIARSNEKILEPIFVDQDLQGLRVFLEDNVIPLPSNYYSNYIPWVEHVDDHLISSLSFNGYYQDIIIINPDSLEATKIIDRRYAGYSYLKTEDYQYLFDGKLAVYDENGSLIDEVFTRGRKILFASQNIYIHVRSYSKDYSMVTNTFYILNPHQPLIYKASSDFSIVNIIFIVGFVFTYLIIDRRKTTVE